jgi:hypothetical protein
VIVTVYASRAEAQPNHAVPLASATPAQLDLHPNSNYDTLLGRVRQRCQQVTLLASRLVSQLLPVALDLAASYIVQQTREVTTLPPVRIVFSPTPVPDGNISNTDMLSTLPDAVPTCHSPCTPMAVEQAPAKSTSAQSDTLALDTLPPEEPVDIVDVPLLELSKLAVEPQPTAELTAQPQPLAQPQRVALRPGRLIPETASPQHALSTVPRPLRTASVRAAPAVPAASLPGAYVDLVRAHGGSYGYGCRVGDQRSI